MQLSKISYSEFEGTPQEWKLEGLSLKDTNLIVGKNASGKSRALNIIRSLARHLAGIDPIHISGNYDIEFSHDGQTLRYHLKYEDETVLEERFSINNDILLDRWEGGEGTILAEALDDGKKHIRFQTPPTELAVVARRDAIQHKYLEPLNAWGSSLRHYYFGTALGKTHLAVFVENVGTKPDEWDPNTVVAIFRKADKDIGNEFRQAILSDMQKLGYDVDDVGIMAPVSVRITGNIPAEPVGLYIKERDLPGITDQHSMSQGMFRALSLLIQINYSQKAGKSTCILIDDIGEGLDFDRSCRLIDILREKTKLSNTQLVLTTNDRFIMNRVPLEEWSVVQRHGNHVQVLNYDNSRRIFEDFKFTGLSNFSFLEMDFASGPPPEEPEGNE